MRGSPPPVRCYSCYPRSIPACAGEPTGNDRPAARRWVYPRVCGGTRAGKRPNYRSGGLSPRVRGNLTLSIAHRVVDRSIPACAGEPHSEEWRVPLIPVYPRVCGGTVQVHLDHKLITGLSPRVRGNQRLMTKTGTQVRSIPACAGEPLSAHPCLYKPLFYPRVCGGTPLITRRLRRIDGLSPRVRGNQLKDRTPHISPRSIPACAGEPTAPNRRLQRNTVYPRVCGGTHCHRTGRRRLGGLSPRVRGNHEQVSGRLRFFWSIPACAGEPRRLRLSSRPERVYPRVCGGTTDTPISFLSTGGLSPRVRGNLLRKADARRKRGSIPACAGEPT